MKCSVFLLVLGLFSLFTYKCLFVFVYSQIIYYEVVVLLLY